MDSNVRFILVLFLIIFCSIFLEFCTECYSQDVHSRQNQNDKISEVLKIFIDCEDCDFFYIRNSIKFVNFVRDPHLADVHVLITHQKTASDGRKFTIRFIGKQRFRNMEQSLYFVSPQSATDDQTRQVQTKMIKLGLMPFVSQTSIVNLIDIEYDEQEADSVRKLDTDPWMYWIFHIDAEGKIEAEESQNEFNIVNGMSAERITEIWKIKSEFKYEFLQENFKDDGEKIKSQRTEWEADAEIIKSLNSYWSVGLFGSGNSSTHKNIKLSWGVASGIEYNFFPWEQSDRRIFSISYSPGIRTFNYNEETLYGKLEEKLFYGRMRLELRMTQPWGEVDVSLENFHYYYDFSKNNFKLETELSLRITEGLSFKLDLEAESIHDQLYLPKGDATLQEILLEQQQLATTYDLSILFGLRYSFGSIYNNIVNRRF